MAKMGAILATGILNAGGRNCTISLRSPDTQTLRMSSVVGLAVFLQYWYVCVWGGVGGSELRW